MESSRLQVFPIAGEAGRFHVKSAKSELLYLVDLNELADGWCGCQHFEYRLEKQLSEELPVTECKHITAARAYAAQPMRGRV